MRQIDFLEIIENPIASYQEFSDRIAEYGQMAPFPEFKEVVEFLLQELNTEYVHSILSKHKALLLELNEVKTFLFHLNLSFSVDEGIEYPYAIPFEAPYPYRPTIDAIEAAVRFLDKINRLDETNRAVKLYHFDRYCYHRHALVTNTDVIVFPTHRELTMHDFIKTRSVPVEFVGVVSKTIRVDGHHQSPLDFWYHDFNHARRLYAYILKRIQALKLTTASEKMEYYKQVNAFVVDVIVKNFLETKESDEESQAIQDLAVLIIFEVVHETAVTLEKEELIKDILRGNGPQPFEYIHDGTVHNPEDLRTPVGNLESGASKNNSNQMSHVRYFLDDTSIGLLANVFRKLNHFYYDTTEEVGANLLEAKYRSPEFVVKGVRKIFEVIGYTETVSDEVLLDLILNTEGTKEVILNKGVYDDGVGVVATEPLRSDEIIEMIAKKRKKVYTFFGYSALQYEDEQKLLLATKDELSQLSPSEYIVCIGATQEGIGKVYEVAKSLGFETIGVVSTQALTYSGKFSDHVDMIYIVNDDNWGGFVPYTNKLAETTKTFLAVSDTISAYGGGENTAITLEQADILGITTKFTSMDMNHTLAKKKGVTIVTGLAELYWNNKNTQ